MANHTPGPWTYNEESGDFRGVHNAWIAQLANFRDFSDVQLMIASPDLLATCQRIHDWITMNSEQPIEVGSEIELQLRKAIAKAITNF